MARSFRASYARVGREVGDELPNAARGAPTTVRGRQAIFTAARNPEQTCLRRTGLDVEGPAMHHGRPEPR